MLGIIISVIIGILGGLFFKNGFILENVDSFISLGLFLLLFCEACVLYCSQCN